MSNEQKKSKSVQVASYLVSKGGTKYLKFGPRLDKDGDVVGPNPFPLTINEGDVLYVKVFDEEFREKFGIPDYVVGRLEMPEQEPKEERSERSAPKRSTKKAQPKADVFDDADDE